MEKINLQLTEREYLAIAELLAQVTSRGYKKAVGEHVIAESKVQFNTETFDVLKMIRRKVN